MTWIDSDPVSHKIGHAQEASIIKWKWYIQNTAKAGKGGAAKLHEIIEELTDGFVKPPLVSGPILQSPVKWGLPYGSLSDQKSTMPGLQTDQPNILARSGIGKLSPMTLTPK